ncbi:hypothetical protein QAD02_022509 [Eretmocerus hayati]|uniref:Uncharacterized protein n=1 Tax=Eretmocerus hayati TaxID=131215 RepID=A0ACC2PY42_9HYME|nr:hypothetical protein QAD02_022509 [Eretmocerus hayati]
MRSILISRLLEARLKVKKIKRWLMQPIIPMELRWITFCKANLQRRFLVPIMSPSPLMFMVSIRALRDYSDVAVIATGARSRCFKVVRAARRILVLLKASIVWAMSKIWGEPSETIAPLSCR